MHTISFNAYYDYKKLNEHKYSWPFEFVILSSEKTEVFKLQGIYIQNIRNLNRGKNDTSYEENEIDIWSIINPKLHDYVINKDSVYQILDIEISEEIDEPKIREIITKFETLIKFYNSNPAIMVSSEMPDITPKKSIKLKNCFENSAFIYEDGYYFK